VNYTLKKSLGQHFLKDENISQRIVEAILDEQPQQLLEIGPGGGAITKYLINQKHLDFKAYDVDEEKILYLQHSFPEYANCFILQDILKAPLPFAGSFMVAGNFPYNISSQILFKILDWKDHVPSVIGMFQKEVADRVAAKEGSRTYGIISVLIQAFYDVELLFNVEADAFNPPPKVRSAVIRLKRKEENTEMTSEKDFSLLVKTAFQQRRKMLRNTLKSLLPADMLQDVFFDQRAEQISVIEFASLTFKMRDKRADYNY
jgi:16S rRNA (adenine1518-N6/adenine1519-N6)-dimethyltransferase